MNVFCIPFILVQVVKGQIADKYRVQGI